MGKLACPKNLVRNNLIASDRNPLRLAQVKHGFKKNGKALGITHGSKMQNEELRIKRCIVLG